MPDPVQDADDEALRTARALIRIRHAALSYTDSVTNLPGISRIAFGIGPEDQAVTLMSSLAPHHAGLSTHPACAIMLGEPGAKGDPLSHPRLMIQATARLVANDDPTRPALRAHWLADHPKSTLYVDFADFAFVRFTITSAFINGGFGRAHRIAPAALFETLD